jgi:hypothetical protein
VEPITHATLPAFVLVPGLTTMCIPPVQVSEIGC